jgi:transketolase
MKLVNENIRLNKLMSIVDSKTGKVRKTYSIKQLKETANYLRGMVLVAINCAKSGHPGGTLSIMDITTALYLKVANHDPKDPNWEDRDRIIFSAGHKAPALYLGLGISGYFSIEEVVTLRKFGSPFQGHPHWLKLAGVEMSTGSLGQGLGIAVGFALAGKLNKKDYKVYAITGDGEWDEGSMWEAAMSAANFNLDNLIIIIDRNHLQIDGNTEEVMKLGLMEKKLASFGFEVFKIDGNNMEEIIKTLEKAKKIKSKPVAIVAKTIKGKGVSFMENKAGWHGVAPNNEQLEQALKELKIIDKINVVRLKEKAAAFQKNVDKKISALVPKFSKDYFWNRQQVMKVVMEPTRFGFGQALEKNGNDERIVCLGLDISDSVKISDFYKKNPERKPRFLSMGIQEQNATVVAAGLAKEGKLPVMSTYGVFCSQRNSDQIRTTICYGELNVFLAGAHGGISVGADGATHQSLEEIFSVACLPNMNFVMPCDSVETKKATEYLLLKLKGPKYLRFAREATPIVSTEKTPFVFGKANIYRFRKVKDNFKEAFDVYLASKYKDEKEEVAIFACGCEVPEAMRAAWILKEHYKLETRVINIHTIKPIDKETIIKTAEEVKIIVTAEEHQKGGFGNLVATTIMEANLNNIPKFAMIGVEDRFGESGEPWELLKAFGLTAEFIVKKVINLKKYL